MDRSDWDTLRTKFTELFKTKTRDEWDEILDGTDACYAPVLTMSEAAENAHIKARSTIIERDGVPQPAPAPRFSRTAAEVQRPAPWAGQHTDEALVDVGLRRRRDRQAPRSRRDRAERAHGVAERQVTDAMTRCEAFFEQCGVGRRRR